MAYDPIEANDSVSPNSGGFSYEGARAQWTFHVDGADFEETALEILGGVETLGDGRLKRTNPRVHPQMPWLSATSINFRGVGTKKDGVRAAFVDSGASEDTPAVTGEYLLYPSYDFVTDFATLPYFLATDEEVDVVESSWFDDDGNQVAATYAEEWQRYTDFPKLPASEFLQFKQGQMQFRTRSGDVPNDATFAGLVRIPMAKQLLRVMWYRVPASYVDSRRSYLQRLMWRVNQTVFLGYEPGELLFEGYSFPKRFTPPFPEEDEFFEGTFSTDKVLDLELLIRVCHFTTDDAPDVGNPNWIVNGHNLYPHYGDRRFYYASTTNADTAKQVPTYRSAPFQLLFTDPDFVQDIGVLR